MTACDSFRFPVCDYIKIETPVNMFLSKFWKVFKNIFWQNISEWLLLGFIYEFWNVFQNTYFIENFWETVYFMYKLQNFNNQIQ